MKTLKIIATIIISSVWLGSCSDFLDKEPYTLTVETYFNTEAELQTFLTGVYSPLMQYGFYGNFYFLYNAGGDDLSFYQRSNPTSSIICNNANSSTPSIIAYWRLLYDGINRANILLENVDKNLSISETIRNRVKAEALFLRSFYYFNLIQGWGDVPMRLHSISSPDNLSIPRTPKQTIYDQIISDIKSTIPYLRVSNTISYTGVVTQSAAKGILARIYLFRAGENFRDIEVGNTPTNSTDSILQYFTHARDWALEVKSSGIHSLANSYKSIYIDMCTDKYNSSGNLESIWEVEEAGALLTPEVAAGRLGNVIGFGGGIDYSTIATISGLKGMSNPGFSYKFIYNSVKLFEMYESEGDTARADWNITPYDYTYSTVAPKAVTGRVYYFGKRPAGLTSIEGYPCTEGTATVANANKTRCCAKYRRELEVVTPKAKNYTPINAPIIHYSDILLMIAEAENEINDNPTDLAYECLNDVRSRVHISTLSGLNKDDFRSAIKKERAMELCFEGIRRWDLIRWGEFYTAMNDMPNDVAKTSWSSSMKYATNYYKVSHAYNFYPIPDNEMSVNKAIITNNPGW